MKWFIFGFLIFLIILKIESKPFFKSNFRSTTESNIADLRERLETSSSLSPPNEDDNQAVPSFIQKKIAKIYRKLQFFTSLANGFTTKKPETDVDFEDIDNDNDFPTKSTVTIEEAGMNNSTTLTENEFPISSNVTVIKNNDNKDKEELDMTARLQNVKYEFSPVGIGIYFMELVGSLVGLVYGAALQVSNATQQPSV